MLLLAAGHHALTAAAAALHPQPLGALTPPTVPPSPSPPQPFSGDEAGTNADNNAACCICLDALHRAARAAPPAHPQVRATCTATAGLMPQVAAPAPLAGRPLPARQRRPQVKKQQKMQPAAAQLATPAASLTTHRRAVAPRPRHPSCSCQASGLESGRRPRPGEGVSSGRGGKQRTEGVSSGQGVKM